MPPSKRLLQRMRHEFKLVLEDPPPGVIAWPYPEGSVTSMRAQVEGPSDTPYEAGVFELEISIPEMCVRACGPALVNA
jgi:ubiquitin-protein ligase